MESFVPLEDSEFPKEKFELNCSGRRNRENKKTIKWNSREHVTELEDNRWTRRIKVEAETEVSHKKCMQTAQNT